VQGTSLSACGIRILLVCPNAIDYKFNEEDIQLTMSQNQVDPFS